MSEPITTACCLGGLLCVVIGLAIFFNQLAKMNAKKTETAGMNFIKLHRDTLDVVADLSREVAGDLFIAIAKNEKPTDPAALIFWLLLQKQFERDKESYKKICEERSEAGKKGMEARWGKPKQNPNETQTKPNDNKNNNCYQTITNDNKNNQEKEKEKERREREKNKREEKEKEEEKEIKKKEEEKFIPKIFLECDKNFAELFFEKTGEEFLFLQKKTEKDIPEIIEAWAEEFQKLREIDKLEPQQIEYLLLWLFDSNSVDANFWKKQIKSPAKFRKKNKDGVQYWRVLVSKIKENTKKEIPTF